MKQDMELIKIILQTLSDDENYFMKLDVLAKKIQETTKEDALFNNKFVGHFFLAKDTKLIEELGVCFFVGQQFTTPTPANGGKVRITSQGLDFLKALENENVLNKIKNLSLGVASDVGKNLLTAFLCKTLSI